MLDNRDETSATSGMHTAAYRSLDPAGDGSLVLVAKLAQLAHMAYDVPKRFDPSQILAVGTQLFRNAGIGCQASQCTSGVVEMLQLNEVNPLPLLP